MADAGMKSKVLSSHATEFISDLSRDWKGTGHTGGTAKRTPADFLPHLRKLKLASLDTVAVEDVNAG